MNVNEAKAKTCPMAMNIPMSAVKDVDRLCVADRCMAWIPFQEFPKGTALPATKSTTDGYCGMVHPRD